MKWATATLILALLVLLLGDWSGSQGQALNVLGSTSIQPFSEMLAQEFAKSERSFVVDVQGGGSTAGVQAAKEGVAEVGMVSRSLKPDEAAIFREVVIARDGLAIVVHPSNPVSDLTRVQVAELFVGKLTNWKQVGGPDREVRLITREEGSGTREAFQKLVMENLPKGQQRISRRALTQESNGSVRELVIHDPAAIGYMSLGLVHGLKAVRIDGVEPTSANVVSKRYPLVRPFLFITKGVPGPKAMKFIDYVLSPAGQALLEKEGLVRVQ